MRHGANLDYYRLLLETTRASEFELWIIFMLEAVQATADWTTAKIVAMRALAEHTTAYMRRRLPQDPESQSASSHGKNV